MSRSSTPPGTILLALLAACAADRVGEPVFAPPFDRVEVAPDSAVLTALGDSLRFAATAFDSLGQAVPGARFVWVALDRRVAAVDDSGLVEAATAGGPVGIEVSAGGRADTAWVTVRPVIAAVRVTPGADTLRAGQATSFTATPVDSGGGAIPGLAVRWATSDSSVATVDSSGVVQAIGPGSATVLAAAPGASGSATLVVLAGQGQAPDILLILPDDLRPDRLDGLPLTSALFRQGSVRFGSAIAPVPLGSPSRASLLTGRSPRSHGVLTDLGPAGGAQALGAAATLATWLRLAGYRTAYVGEYLAETDRIGTLPPPGWDDWRVLWRGLLGPELYFDYVLDEDGTLSRFGQDPAVYSTDLLTARALRIIAGTPDHRPLFLVYAPFAPRFPATPAPRDVGAFAGAPQALPPSYQEDDVADKPLWVRQQPQLVPREIADELRYRERYLEALVAVDRGVGAISQALERRGRLRDAVVLLTSDNGVHQGEHRVAATRLGSPYEEAIRVPLLIRAPGIVAGSDSGLASLLDVAPTLLELAGVPLPAGLEGGSLVDRLRRRGSVPREGLLVEYFGEGPSTPVSRRFEAVRTEGAVYVEYQNGEREFYDLGRDPFQLENRVTDPAAQAEVRRLTGLLGRLRGP